MLDNRYQISGILERSEVGVESHVGPQSQQEDAAVGIYIYTVSQFIAQGLLQ